MDELMTICCFCNSKNLKILYSDAYHPYKKDHGPFNFYKCKNCGSGLTFPLPSPENLEALYKNFSGGLIPRIREIRDSNPLSRWYSQCIKHAFKGYLPPNNNFNWIDVGAGNGELSELMASKFISSQGTAMDFHVTPHLLEKLKNVRWTNIDLNKIHLHEILKTDLIFLITVLEHVLYPDKLVNHLLKGLNPGGKLYITVPDFGSLASGVLKNKWPYYLPGEHLNIPSKKGMGLMLQNLCKNEFTHKKYSIMVKSTVLPYPLGYYLSYWGIERKSIFSKAAVRLPTGILEASVSLRDPKYI